MSEYFCSRLYIVVSNFTTRVSHIRLPFKPTHFLLSEPPNYIYFSFTWWRTYLYRLVAPVWCMIILRCNSRFFTLSETPFVRVAFTRTTPKIRFCPYLNRVYCTNAAYQPRAPRTPPTPKTISIKWREKRISAPQNRISYMKIV